jgi:hypothetical protein
MARHDFHLRCISLKPLFVQELHCWYQFYNYYKSDFVGKRYKDLITMETREDLDFMFYGIMSLTEYAINEIHTEVVPSRLNSDIIENIFCQQRSIYHGPTTNPTYNRYRTGTNSVYRFPTVSFWQTCFSHALNQLYASLSLLILVSFISFIGRSSLKKETKKLVFSRNCITPHNAFCSAIYSQIVPNKWEII